MGSLEDLREKLEAMVQEYKALRTKEQVLKREARAADAAWIMELAGSRKGCGHVKALLPALALPA